MSLLHRLGVCALIITLFSCFLGALCGWAAVRGWMLHEYFSHTCFFVILFISRFCFACDIGEPHWDPNQCLDRGGLCCC